MFSNGNRLRAASAGQFPPCRQPHLVALNAGNRAGRPCVEAQLHAVQVCSSSTGTCSSLRKNMMHAKKGEGGGVCDPRVFCASKNPNFLARWRVRGRPAVRGPAGTGSVGDGVGEGRWCPIYQNTHVQIPPSMIALSKDGRS